MKNYLSTKRGNSRRGFLPKGLRYALYGLVLCSIAYWLVPRLVFGAVSIVLYPFETVRLWVLESQDSLPNYLRERHTLLAELEALKQQVATTAGTEHTLVKLTKENEQFRQLCEAVPEERVIARVVGRPADLPYDVLMLDRGSDHGVVEAAPVFVGRDQVVGYVSRVYPRTALVTLVTTADFTSMAYILGPNIYTYAKGVGGGMLEVQVPQGLPLAVGDRVILPAIDSGVYGAIEYIKTTPTQPEQFGYVPLPLNLQSMQYVSVGREAIVPHSYAEAERLLETMRDDLFTIALPDGVLVTPSLVSTTTVPTSTVPEAPASSSATTIGE